MQGTTPKDVPHAIYLGNVLAWDKVDAGGGEEQEEVGGAMSCQHPSRHRQRPPRL